MLTLKLAFRNMLAHRQRSLIMFVISALVSCVVFLFMAFSDGEMENFKTGLMALDDPASDLVVYAPGLKTATDEGEDWKQLATHSIKGYPRILDGLRGLPFVRRAAIPTTKFTLDIIAGGKRNQHFYFRGVDPANAWQVKEHLRMKEGAFFEPSDKPEIILHYKTASTMKLHPGDTVTLTGRDLFGQVFAQEAVFKGYFAGEQDLVNLAELGFMNMAAYQLVSGLAPDETMSIAVDLQKGESKKEALGRLSQWAKEQKLELEAWDFDDIPKATVGVYALMRVYGLVRLILQAMSVSILGIVAFGMMSVVAVNLYDRKREIGTYYCLGSEKAFLIRLYTLEILMINLVSTLAGVLAGLGVRQLIQSLGITTEEAGLQTVFGGSHFTLGFTPSSVGFIVSSMLLITFVTAVTNLGSRLRVSPVAALRETE